jgi:hypothetical protein
MEEGSPISADELNSDIGGLKTERMQQNKKKIIIAASITLGVILLIVLIIVLATAGKGSSSSSEEDETAGKEVLGEIECLYDIQTKSEPTDLLGEEFDKSFLMSIEIEGTKIKYSKSYKFDKIGSKKVKYYIYDKSIQINNMFKDVDALTSAKFVSNTNVKITSMESLFENCISLEKFEIDGFDTSEVKSLKKLFYNCIIYSSLDFLDKISTKQITDMSYMFSASDVVLFSPENLDLSSVTDMSHMFENCNSLQGVLLPENINSNHLTDISFMFKGCQSLEDLDIES